MNPSYPGKFLTRENDRVFKAESISITYNPYKHMSSNLFLKCNHRLYVKQISGLIFVLAVHTVPYTENRF